LKSFRYLFVLMIVGYGLLDERIFAAR